MPEERDGMPKALTNRRVVSDYVPVLVTIEGSQAYEKPSYETLHRARRIATYGHALFYVTIMYYKVLQASTTDGTQLVGEAYGQVGTLVSD